MGLLAAALGSGWQVLVLSDRGLESPDLFRTIVGLGWHPLMRVKAHEKGVELSWQVGGEVPAAVRP